MAYDPARYGRAVSDYDRLYPGDEVQNAAAVEMIAALAGARADRAVLEFGLGTGRLALELHRRGLRVAGIDASDRMIAQLRTKPGGDEIEVVVGDYRDARFPGSFSVVVLALNGIFDERGADAQLDIFRNARRHLADDGAFVVEAWVVNDAQRSGDWSIVPRFVHSEHVELQLARYDLATNTIERTLVHLTPAGTEFVTVRDTYASPGELDVMARVTGFTRTARYRDWLKTPFTSTSSTHVSVYGCARASEEP